MYTQNSRDTSLRREEEMKEVTAHFKGLAGASFQQRRNDWNRLLVAEVWNLLVLLGIHGSLVDV